MNPKQLVKQSETLLRCHCQITSDQNLEEELYRPRLQNPWCCPLKPSLKYKWLQDTKWNNAQLYILQIISPLHYRHFFTFLRACKTYRWQITLFCWSWLSVKILFAWGSVCWSHWFDTLIYPWISETSRNELLFWYTKYICLQLFRLLSEVLKVDYSNLFRYFVCKVKFLRLSTLSHLLFTWSASHNWVRHKNDKPTTQMPRVGGGLRRYEGNSLPVTKPPTHRNKWQTVKAFVTDQPHRLRRLASLQFSRCIREISKNTLRGKRFWYNL